MMEFSKRWPKMTKRPPWLHEFIIGGPLLLWFDISHLKIFNIVRNRIHFLQNSHKKIYGREGISSFFEYDCIGFREEESETVFWYPGRDGVECLSKESRVVRLEDWREMLYLLAKSCWKTGKSIWIEHSNILWQEDNCSIQLMAQRWVIRFLHEYSLLWHVETSLITSSSWEAHDHWRKNLNKTQQRSS